MPTTISTSPRAWRQPAVAAGRTNDLLACTALSVIGLLLAVLVVNFEINRAGGHSERWRRRCRPDRYDRAGHSLSLPGASPGRAGP